MKEIKNEKLEKEEKEVSFPRAILNFSKELNELLVSGGLQNGEELAGTPAIVDCPLGNGHIVMFACNPFWRHITHGSFFLVFNILLHYDHLDSGKESKD